MRFDENADLDTSQIDDLGAPAAAGVAVRSVAGSRSVGVA